MPLSTVLGAQSLVQPAVCTTATRPASPYTGQAIYDTTISALLIWNGTAWTGTGGLQLVTTATCSSGGTAVGGVVTIGSAVSSVTVATAFSATYDNYYIKISGGVSSANNALNMTLGSTSTGYYWVGQNQQYGTNTITASNASNSSSFASVAYGSTNNISGQIFIDAPNLAKRTLIRFQATGSSTDYFRNDAQGFLDDATQYTAFTLTAGSGTITGGTVRVYGYQNS